MIIGTAGHIDHGKTSLVRALTGVDTDRLPEEKRRGITIELGFAPLELPRVGTVGVVDVPGHEAFVRTMVAGATGIDVALLVVAADEGVMPQTVEHLSILGLLGTRAGVVALTKCDLVDEEWLSLVSAEVTETLRGTPLENAPVVRTSATTGAGLDELRAALGAAMATIPAREAGDAFRLPIDRAFSVRGTGTVVTGTVWEGSVAVGDTLVVQPSGKQVRVRGVQAHSRDIARAVPGTRAAVAITGAEVADVERGAWLCGESDWPVTTLVRAEVSLLGDANHPLRPREWVRLHLGTADIGARIVVSGGALEPGEQRPARVVLQEPVLARAGDRFVLRLASPPSTLGGGVVVDPLPARRRAPLWNRVERADQSLGRLLREAGAAGLSLADIGVRTGVTRAVLEGLLKRKELALVIGSRAWDPAVLAEVSAELERLVRDEHRRNPLGEGPAVAAATAAVRSPVELVDRAIAGLVAGGTLERRGAVLAVAGWRPTFDAGDSAFRADLLRTIRHAGPEPPDVAALTELHRRDPVPVLRLLERDGEVVAVETGRFYAAEELEKLVGKLRDGMTKGREHSPSELRDVLGLSRKYLIPFLEYCDRKRITERRATGRVLVG